MPRYCPRCGEELVDRFVEERNRRFCPACDEIIYRNPKPCAGVLVVDDDSVLLVKRGVPPAVGTWSVPAGFLEADEPPEEAAARELHEETGVTVSPDDITLHDTIFKNGPSGHALILVYVAPRRATEGKPVAGTDADGARFWTRDQISDMDIEPGYRDIILSAVDDIE